MVSRDQAGSWSAEGEGKVECCCAADLALLGLSPSPNHKVGSQAARRGACSARSRVLAVFNRTHHLAGSVGTHRPRPIEVTISLVHSKWGRRLSASSNVGSLGILVSCLSGYNTMRYPFKADLTSSHVLLVLLPEVL